MPRPTTGTLHHVEIWVPDLDRAVASFGVLLEALGYTPFQSWAAGRSWSLGATYLVVERSPALTAGHHDRRRPGLNHLAFHVEGRDALDRLVGEVLGHGWTLMYPDRHPHAGGEQTYAAYLENDDGFEVELVANDPPEPGGAS
ncbi:VOC family protein [Streptomyces sp. NPDC048338]|uniref:VOC family protein n=1 Tax=Streptomyces sp. NPDC048338 TaxID=3365536 RepID=UPI003711A03F